MAEVKEGLTSCNQFFSPFPSPTCMIDTLWIFFLWTALKFLIMICQLCHFATLNDNVKLRTYVEKSNSQINILRTLNMSLRVANISEGINYPRKMLQ